MSHAINYPSIISQPGSASRNIQPILEALKDLLTPAGVLELDPSSGLNGRSDQEVRNAEPQDATRSSPRRVLELASHPYEHIEAYARKFPKWEWYGSVRDAQQEAYVSFSWLVHSNVVRVLGAFI